MTTKLLVEAMMRLVLERQVDVSEQIENRPSKRLSYEAFALRELMKSLVRSMNLMDVIDSVSEEDNVYNMYDLEAQRIIRSMESK